jgi:hypothetical protein
MKMDARWISNSYSVAVVFLFQAFHKILRQKTSFEPLEWEVCDVFSE